MTDLIVDFTLDWGDEVEKRHAAAAQAFAVSAALRVEVYPSEGPPPYVAQVYLRSYVSIFLGTIAHPARWPTLAEVEAAVRAWRPDVNLEGVAWNVGPDSPPTVHCATCTCRERAEREVE